MYLKWSTLPKKRLHPVFLKYILQSEGLHAHHLTITLPFQKAKSSWMKPGEPETQLEWGQLEHVRQDRLILSMLSKARGPQIFCSQDFGTWWPQNWRCWQSKTGWKVGQRVGWASKAWRETWRPSCVCVCVCACACVIPLGARGLGRHSPEPPSARPRAAGGTAGPRWARPEAARWHPRCSGHTASVAPAPGLQHGDTEGQWARTGSQEQAVQRLSRHGLPWSRLRPQGPHDGFPQPTRGPHFLPPCSSSQLIY